jgi:hypothetical protein
MNRPGPHLEVGALFLAFNQGNFIPFWKDCHTSGRISLLGQTEFGVNDRFTPKLTCTPGEVGEVRPLHDLLFGLLRF